MIVIIRVTECVNEIIEAEKIVKGKTEEDAIVAYLQQLGLAYKRSK